ncbi:collagen [Mactra antiquata]
MNYFFTIVLVTLVGTTASCGTNCVLSAWSAWSEPYGFGQIKRTRTITANATGCGTCSGALFEEIYTDSEVPPTDVADGICNNFLDDDGCKRDIVLILDGSGSVSIENFNDMKLYFVDILSLLCPQPTPFDNDVHQLAVVLFSSSSSIRFDFNDYNNQNDYFNALLNVPYPSGSTQIQLAFNQADELFSNPIYGARANDSNNVCVKQQVMVFTDGEPTSPDAALAAAINLKSKYEVFGFIIGTFNIAQQQTLAQYVSDPVEEHLFVVDTFNIFSNVVDLLVPCRDGYPCLNVK